MTRVVNTQECPIFCRDNLLLLWPVNKQMEVTASSKPARQLGNTDIFLQKILCECTIYLARHFPRDRKGLTKISSAGQKPIRRSANSVSSILVWTTDSTGLIGGRSIVTNSGSSPIPSGSYRTSAGSVCPTSRRHLALPFDCGPSVLGRA